VKLLHERFACAKHLGNCFKTLGTNAFAEFEDRDGYVEKTAAPIFESCRYNKTGISPKLLRAKLYPEAN